MSSCCLSGHVQQGTPKGHVETIAGLQTYVAEPKDGSKWKTVIFLVDSESSCLIHYHIAEQLTYFSLRLGIQQHTSAGRRVRCSRFHRLHS